MNTESLYLIINKNNAVIDWCNDMVDQYIQRRTILPWWKWREYRANINRCWYYLEIAKRIVRENNKWMESFHKEEQCTHTEQKL